MDLLSDISPALALRFALLAALLCASVATDVRRRRIPNGITYSAIGAALLTDLACDGRRGVLLAVAGAVVGGAIFLLPALLLKLGMGDVKLAMAIGAIGGPEFALWASLFGMVAGGVAALVALRREDALQQVSSGMATEMAAGAVPPAASGLSIPYAVPLAAGALLALLTPGLPR